jgi:hypothetical protein
MPSGALRVWGAVFLALRPVVLCPAEFVLSFEYLALIRVIRLPLEHANRLEKKPRRSGAKVAST